MNPLIYFLIIFKASLLSTGGMGNLPSIYQDLLANGWASEADFSKSIAIGQITPGPNGLWVLSLSYQVYGWAGVVLSLLAITLPPFFVLALAAVYQKLEHRPAVRGIMRGLSLAVVGLVVPICFSLLNVPGLDWRGGLIALGAFALAATNRIHVIFVLALAAVAGLVLFG